MERAVTPEHNDRHARASRVQSVDRAVVLLQAVAVASGPAATAAALAEACALNRATAWRILSTLESHGMVTYQRGTGRWSVGPAVAEIARSVGVDDLVAAAHPVLARLSGLTGETADLAVLRGRDLTYVDEVRPRAVLSAEWLGRTVPLHATSTGKALLAAVGDGERRRLLPPDLTAHTATTITDPDALATELALTRRRGYATCHGELESHLHGVSAAVLAPAGRVLGVLSIWGPDVRVTADRLPALGALAVGAAAEVVAAVGAVRGQG
jgi:DNA-binding IclR family transcriptional regulator